MPGRPRPRAVAPGLHFLPRNRQPLAKRTVYGSEIVISKKAILVIIAILGPVAATGAALGQEAVEYTFHWAPSPQQDDMGNALMPAVGYEGWMVAGADPERPLESIAQVYLHPILNRGTGYKLMTMKRMIKEYQVDGVVLHSDRSCKPYSIGQIDQRERLVKEQGGPALLLEADHNDPRVFSEEQAANRLAAFIEVLGETGDN